MDGGHSSHSSHDKHEGHDPEMFRRRFWLSLALTIPLVVTSHMVMDWFGYNLSFTGMSWLGPVLGSIVFLWGGWPFLAGGVAEVRDRQPGMMLLISMAITVAYVASMATTLDWLDLEFWWELAALVTIMLLGHWQEMKAIGQARGALAALAELLPDDAEVVDGDEVRPVAVDELRVGDVVLVRSGGRVPADGVIVDGEAELDESMITGESRPVARAIGERVVAGTVSTDSSIRVRVDAVGDDTALAGIQRLVAEAQSSNSRAQALADRFAALLFYVATASGVITFLAWWAAGDVDDAVVRTVTVLVIACPHALGLAIPLVISLSTAVSAQAGILVKDRLALEQMRSIDIVLFDKTGTLTRGAHVVAGVAAANGVTDAEVLRIAGGVESDSEHPLARAIVTAARDRGEVARADGFRSLTGRGVQATIEGTAYAVGGPALLRERSLDVPGELAPSIEQWTDRGAAVLYLIRGEEVIGVFALEDEVRPEARSAVRELRELGVKVAMITGDARQVADAVARDLGIDEVFSEVLPEDKDQAVVELQRRGLTVAMVGDGVNDAPALARANVGLAIGSGTDVAIESAGVVLASSDPSRVSGVIRLSRASYRKMIQNLAWAAGYNVVALPLAAGVLAWAGITLSPAVGAILMSLSTIVVALNAQLLRRVRLTADEDDVSADTPSRYSDPMSTTGRPDSRLSAPAVKLGAYGLMLGVALGGGALVGATLGPAASDEAAADHADDAHAGATDGDDAAAAMLPAGLAISRDGYTLSLTAADPVAGSASALAFVISGPDGDPVTDYDVEHDKELHLVVVGRDLVGYAHVHPTRDDGGMWRVTLPPLTAGSYRVFADFTPVGGARLTLGADLAVPGEYEPAGLPAVSSVATVDDYEVTFGGDVVAGRESELTLTVERDGSAVADLEPYLGALGHLVAIRSGDLAYLHVHPLDESTGPGGPDVRFAVEVPSTGTYRLFFDFSHDGTVRTAATTVVAASGDPEVAPSDDYTTSPGGSDAPHHDGTSSDD
ncbi:MAG: copper-translocating P-type ATPase [Acidimicrobiia bacterium]|nr:copper-translocating P-type ATPase [Acidimicrobiia bacterium]